MNDNKEKKLYLAIDWWQGLNFEEQSYLENKYWHHIPKTGLTNESILKIWIAEIEN